MILGPPENDFGGLLGAKMIPKCKKNNDGKLRFSFQENHVFQGLWKKEMLGPPAGPPKQCPANGG